LIFGRLTAKWRAEPVSGSHITTAMTLGREIGESLTDPQAPPGLTSHWFPMYKYPMPRLPMPPGTLAILVLRVLRSGPLHGYAIAQRIRVLSDSVLAAEEGSLYPTLQRMLLEAWVTSDPGVSETGRRVRFYTLTRDGFKQLKREMAEYEEATAAIQTILRTA